MKFGNAFLFSALIGLLVGCFGFAEEEARMPQESVLNFRDGRFSDGVTHSGERLPDAPRVKTMVETYGLYWATLVKLSNIETSSPVQLSDETQALWTITFNSRMTSYGNSQIVTTEMVQLNPNLATQQKALACNRARDAFFSSTPNNNHMLMSGSSEYAHLKCKDSNPGAAVICTEIYTHRRLTPEEISSACTVQYNANLKLYQASVSGTVKLSFTFWVH